MIGQKKTPFVMFKKLSAEVHSCNPALTTLTLAVKRVNSIVIVSLLLVLSQLYVRVVAAAPVRFKNAFRQIVNFHFSRPFSSFS